MNTCTKRNKQVSKPLLSQELKLRNFYDLLNLPSNEYAIQYIRNRNYTYVILTRPQLYCPKEIGDSSGDNALQSLISTLVMFQRETTSITVHAAKQPTSIKPVQQCCQVLVFIQH
jgi:hypothetical protein